MKALAEAALELRAGSDTRHRELFAFRTWFEVVEYALNEDTGPDLRPSVQLVQDYGPDAILKAVGKLAIEGSEDLTISTNHKVKGRGWRSVAIAPDYRRSSVAARIEERSVPRDFGMLAYVALTRARPTSTVH